MSAEQVLDEVMSQAAEGNGKVIPCPIETGSVPAPEQEELARIRAAIKEAQAKFNVASNSHTFALAFGIPALGIAFIVLAFNHAMLISTSLPEIGFYWRVMILWTLAALVAVPIYYYVFRRGYTTAKDALWREQQAYIAMRLSTEAGRRQYFREELFRLSSKATRVFFGDEKRFAVASRWAAKASDILDGIDKTASLSAVQSYLNSLNELVAREEREQNEENRWQKWAIAVMFLYVGGLVISALLTNSNQAPTTNKVFGVPPSIIFWGAAGSLAAILYRFYTEQGQIRFASEFRWLIARPIIGIIMGAVVYLALASGLVLVSAGGQTADQAVQDEPRMRAFWIVAFLAGFSDKFYLGVIDLLVARTVRSHEKDSNTVEKEIERIPGSSAADEQEDENIAPKSVGHQARRA